MEGACVREPTDDADGPPESGDDLILIVARSGSPFAAKVDFDSQGSQERLGAPEAVGQSPGTVGQLVADPIRSPTTWI
jgi:hypothetical protein